jgi:uncharacterized protein YggU (UPF0235/DUF167 family)
MMAATTASPAWRAVSGGVSLRVRLTPKGARDAIEGVEQDVGGAPALKARVRALPEAGAANAALERLVAKWLGVPGKAVSVYAGTKSRLKTLKVAGDPESIIRLIEQRLANCN